MEWAFDLWDYDDVKENAEGSWRTGARGMGRALLQQAMRFLALRGAQSVAGCVDHDDPRDRDRRPAVRLLESVDFEDVDHLWSYESQRKRSH
jgi:ribosomal protein S18 acetylase RimI-like enzyme